MIRRITILALLAMMAAIPQLSAQGNGGDFLRSIGKIYVVVAVILAIFAGIVVFLIYLDRKLTKLENQIRDHE